MRKISAVKVPAGVEARAKKANSESLESSGKEVTATQLAFWPEETFAMPNSLARSALFAVIRRGRRRMLDNEQIASRLDTQISMTGKQLDQADSDTWMQLMRLAKKQPLGTQIHINRAQVLQAMQRSLGTSEYKWLEDSIDRLHQASLKIETKEYKASLHLINSWLFKKETKEYWIEISPEAAALFDRNLFGYVDIEKRYALGKNDLAKWLQSYISSHAAGVQHTISVELLRSWCGATGRMRDFNISLPKALSLLNTHEITHDAKIRKDGKATWFRPHSTHTLGDSTDSESETILLQ